MFSIFGFVDDALAGKAPDPRQRSAARSKLAKPLSS